MGIRQAIGERPAIATAIAAAFIACALTGIVYEEWPSHPNHRLANSQFYSDDDGTTWFIDDKSNIPPFDHNGKMACGAEVFRYSSGKFVVMYLEKFSDKQEAAIEPTLAQHPEELNSLLQTPMEIKKPGNSKWLAPGAAGYEKTLSLIWPRGTIGVTHLQPTDADAMDQ